MSNKKDPIADAYDRGWSDGMTAAGAHLSAVDESKKAEESNPFIAVMNTFSDSIKIMSDILRFQMRVVRFGFFMIVALILAVVWLAVKS